MRDRMIKYPVEIKCNKDRYTTPVTVEFMSPQRRRDNTINVATIHHTIFAEMKLFNSFVKSIIKNKLFEHPKNFPMEGKYRKYFPDTTEDLDRSKANKSSDSIPLSRPSS